MTEPEILLAASRGNLSRHREKGAWVYHLNHKRISKAPVLELMRRGLLRPEQTGLSVGYFERVEITQKGREALR